MNANNLFWRSACLLLIFIQTYINAQVTYPIEYNVKNNFFTTSTSTTPRSTSIYDNINPYNRHPYSTYDRGVSPKPENYDNSNQYRPQTTSSLNVLPGSERFSGNNYNNVYNNNYNNNDHTSNNFPWNQGPTDFDTNSLYNIWQPNRGDVEMNQAAAIKEATYFIVASKMVRPAQLYRVSVTILQEEQPLTVRAAIQCNGVEIAADYKSVKEGIPETLLVNVPSTIVPGNYKLRVEGLYNHVLGGSAFFNETDLLFSQRSMTIFVQLDKPIYMQGERVRFRTIPINTELKAFAGAIDVFMIDPNDNIVKRWLSRQSNLGTVSLDYQLSDQPVFGEWKIRVVAQNQIEEAKFLVEEYYQTRFEVNVTMPAFFLNTDDYIYGIVMANYTSGAPVRGNLTLKATVRHIKALNTQQQQQHRMSNMPKHYEDTEYAYRYGPEQQQYYEYPEYHSNYNRPIIEKYFNFDESYPFWFRLPNYYEPIPHLKFFDGVYKFHYPIRELLHYVPNLEGMEVVVTASVGDHLLDEVIEGYSIARISNSSMKLSFLGGSPQVFKPGMPIETYLSLSYYDGSPLPFLQNQNGLMEVNTQIETRSGRRDIGQRQVPMLPGHPGIWRYIVDVKDELGMDGARIQEELSQTTSVRIQARFRDGYGQHASAELVLAAHYSPTGQQIKVYTSTKYPEVDDNMIIHVKSNFFIKHFNYLVIAKGIVLINNDQEMSDTIHTMLIPLNADMVPVATIIVWHVGRYGDVVVDSLTFPVHFGRRSKFSVFINNKKARTGHKVEVAIYGEPGSYIGLSGVDRAFYTMQAGHDLTYAKLLHKMATFDQNLNGTHQQKWVSREGDPDEIVHFPSSTYGIDANRTFEFAGLIVFSDFALPRRYSYCNLTQGYGECLLNGRCYKIEKKCDMYNDCEDGTDEIGCQYDNGTELGTFRKYRFNRIQRQYENVWVWKDVNIGPRGRYIFNIPVPSRPVHWMVSAFTMSPTFGFGMLKKPVEYLGILPFFINVEMPNICMQGEQVGIRITVFNYMTDAVEATVVLVGSPDYKFVHVEEGGVVRSYNPRTSYGEHQFFIYIKPQDAAIVYIPIVPTRLGDIDVTVYASTLIGKDQITRRLHVESDGLPQYRHQSMLLDLSNRAYVFQYMHVNVTETPIIPYDYDRYYVYGSNKARISVVGDVVGAIFPTMPVNATSLLNLPMDSAEQNLFSFAVTMYTTLYMRYTQQKNKTLQREAFHYMNVGFQKQLSYMREDGSFSAFRSDWNQSEPSVWLTAYCVRIFQDASFYEWENYIFIDPQIIAKSVGWVLRHQSPEGAFYETTWLPNRKYNNTNIHIKNDQIRYRNITLTAHVLIMLESVRDLTSGLSSQVEIAKQKAVLWLERNIPLIEDQGSAFDVAIVAYALMRCKTSSADQAYLILSARRRTEGDLMYWGRKSVPQPPSKIENQRPFSLPRLPYDYDSENIEATAYALMVYVARQEFVVDKIVRWLNTQRLTDGGWASTFDTATAMWALIEYTSAQRIRDISGIIVSVEATALPGKHQMLHINDRNRAKLQYIDIPNAWGTVKVQASGTGFAILQMSVQYNVDIARFQTQPPVPSFDLRIRPHFYGRNMSHITIHSCQRWIHLNESERSGLTILDVGIPTGYIIQQQDLDAYVLSRRVKNLQRAKYLEKKVIFYFDYLDKEEICINFTVERWYPVANMSRYLPVRVYDYYAPERFNETILDALSTYVLDICHVCGSSQCPYCGIYNSASQLSTPIFVLITATLFYLIMRKITV